MRVYLVFTSAGLHGVYKNKTYAEEVKTLVANKYSLETWLENWGVTDDNPKTSVTFGKDEDNDMQ